jgi:hypothetical protein
MLVLDVTQRKRSLIDSVYASNDSASLVLGADPNDSLLELDISPLA